MTDITCDIIKDLLPLYVDGGLSEDSRKLVEEHIGTCADCGKEHERLMSPDVVTDMQEAEDGKAAIKKIRRRIRVKNVVIALAAAAAALALGLGIIYFAAVKAYPVPYEKSRVYVEGSMLCSRLPYREAYVLQAPDCKTAFTFLAASKRDLQEPDEAFIEHVNIMDMDKFEPAKRLDENGNVVAELGGPTALYYVPPKYAMKLEDQSFWADDEAEMQRQLDELISVSTLLWTAD